MINPGNRELMSNELDIVNGGTHGDRYCCGGPIDPHQIGTGSGDGLGWLRNIGSAIADAVGGAIKIFGL